VNREQVLATTGDAPKAERVDAVSRFAEMLRSATDAVQIGTPMGVEKCTGSVLPIPIDISPCNEERGVDVGNLCLLT
jgi:hypothetical protein